jgi:hypothetical protein
MRSRTLNYTYAHGAANKTLEIDFSHLKYEKIELDAEERDLTINSLYYNIRTGKLVENEIVKYTF